MGGKTDFGSGDPSPENIRWYYSSAEFDLKKLLDLPAKGIFTRFCDGDSLSLEIAYRRNAEEIDAAWWHQHSMAMREPGQPDKPSDTEASHCQAQLEPKGPIVRAGYYEADIAERSMYPIYWKGPSHLLLRGTWFVESPGKQGLWLPLPHALAAKLESAWQSRVFDPLVWQDHKPQPEGVTAARIDIQEILLQDYYALFCSRHKMYLCTTDNLAFMKKWISKDSQPGARLRRGYVAPDQEVRLGAADV